MASLAAHAALAVLLAAAVLAGLRLAGLVLAPVPVLLIALAIATARWLTRRGIERSPALQHPALELSTGFAPPDGYDVRVRRLEDMIHGAHPARRYTSRALAILLADIADASGPDSRARLSPELGELLARARRPEASVPGIDRRTLHRYLRELDALEEGAPTGKEAAP